MLLIGVILIIIAVIVLLVLIFRSPYHYPYHYTYFDVSGKRNVNIYDCLDDYLNKGGIKTFICAHNEIEIWKNKCLQKIEKSPIKKLRKKQYYKRLDDSHAFVMVCTRQQTRYKQVNYQKFAYKVTTECASICTDINFLIARNNQLEAIGFATTLSKYNSNSQRKLMTKELKEMIAQRDNYTCQICGKYMPDGIGLHIDHIIPISKGGKSVPNNLQVLCSKCNGAKSNK